MSRTLLESVSPDLRAHVEDARAKIEDGKLGPALDSLQLAQQNGGAALFEVSYLRALAHWRLGHIDEAQSAAELSAALAPKAVDARVLQGQIMAARSNWDAAAGEFRAATLAAPEEPNNPSGTLAWYRLGECLAQLGYSRAALEAFESFDEAVFETHPEHSNSAEIKPLLERQPRGALPQRLTLLERLGRAKDAVLATRAAMERWPADHELHRAYAVALLASGDAREAFEFLREKLDTSESSATLLSVAVSAARASDGLSGWIDEIDSAIQAGKPPPYAADLVRACTAAGELDAAQRLADRLASSANPSIDRIWDASLIRVARGELADAVRVLADAIRANPAAAELQQRRLTEWCAAIRRSPGMPQSFAALLERPDRDFADNFMLGVIAADLDQIDQADQLLAECLKQRPNLTPAYGVRGRMLLARYDWEGAKRYARNLLGANPNLAIAWALIGDACDGLDDSEEAQKAFKKAIRLAPQESAYPLALAQHLRRTGDLLSAQRYFADAITVDPKNAEAQEGLFDAYLIDGKQRLAEEQLKKMREQDLPADTLRRAESAARFLRGQPREAYIADLKTQLQAHPDDLAVARFLAGLLFTLRDDEAAELVVDAGLRVAPSDYNLLFLKANLRAQQAEFGAAIDLLETLLRRYPNRREVLYLLAKYRVCDFRADDARPLLQRLVDESQDAWSPYHSLLAQSYRLFGRYDEALAVIDASLKKHPQTPELIASKAELLVAAKRGDEALALLSELLDARPDDPQRRFWFVALGREARAFDKVIARQEAWLQAGAANAELRVPLMDELLRTLILAERCDEALKRAQEFTPQFKDAARRRKWLGDAQFCAKQYDKAIDEYEYLLRERFGFDDELRLQVQLQQLDALLEARDYARATERCEEYLRLAAARQSQESEHELLRKLLRIHREAGREPEYAAVLERLHSENPRVALWNNDLGYTWLEMNINLERATKMIRYAVAQDPLNATLLDSLGWAYYKAGDFEGAYKHLSRCTQWVEGHDADQFDHLGDAAWRLGKRDDAARAWKAAASEYERESDARKAETGRALFAERLKAKIAAIESGAAPQTAPTAGEARKGS